MRVELESPTGISVLSTPPPFNLSFGLYSADCQVLLTSFQTKGVEIGWLWIKSRHVALLAILVRLSLFWLMVYPCIVDMVASGVDA